MRLLKNAQGSLVWSKSYKISVVYDGEITGYPLTSFSSYLSTKGAAVDLVREMMISTGEEVEVRSYKRLTDLVIQDEAVQSLANVQPGDCIVCFSKQVSLTSREYSG